MSLSLHKALEPASCTQVNGPLESNPNEVMPEAGNDSVCRRKRPSKHGTFKTCFLLIQWLWEMTFKAPSKLKTIWAKKERNLRYSQLAWIIWLEKDHLEVIYKRLVQKQQQRAYLRT